MSYIPDCRTDENYNEKYLNDKDAEFVAGMDWCRIMAVDNFFDNLDIYTQDFEDDENEFNLLEYLEENEDVRQNLRDCLFHYIEMQRDELITSMIDNMGEEEWAELRQQVDAGKRQNCIETYAFEKEDRNPEV